MNQGQATWIFSKCFEREYVRYSSEGRWRDGEEDKTPFICLDGNFSVEEVEAIAFLMRNKPEALRK